MHAVGIRGYRKYFLAHLLLNNNTRTRKVIIIMYYYSPHPLLI